MIIGNNTNINTRNTCTKKQYVMHAADANIKKMRLQIKHMKKADISALEMLNMTKKHLKNAIIEASADFDFEKAMKSIKLKK